TRLTNHKRARIQRNSVKPPRLRRHRPRTRLRGRPKPTPQLKLPLLHTISLSTIKNLNLLTRLVPLLTEHITTRQREIRDRTIKTMRPQRSQRKTSPIRTTRTLILLRTRTITCASTRHKPSSLRQHLANRGNQRHLAAKTNNKNLVMQQNGHPSPHCNEHAQAEHSTDHE